MAPSLRCMESAPPHTCDKCETAVKVPVSPPLRSRSLAGGTAKLLGPRSQPRMPRDGGDAQKRPYDEQDREWHVLNGVPDPVLNWTDDEIREEHEGDVFQPNAAQDPPKIGTERVVHALDRRKCKHIGPHDAYGEERHCRFHNRLMRNPTEPDDKTEMGELSRGEGETEVAPVPSQYPEARPKQRCHRGAGIGRPKEQKRQAPGHPQRDARPPFTRLKRREDHNRHG